MKKLATFIGSIVILAALVVGGYFAYNRFFANAGEFEISYTYKQLVEGYGDKNVYVTGYKGQAPENVVVADSVNIEGSNRNVRGIDGGAFKRAGTMVTFEAPESCMYFGANVFRDCKKLTTITLKALYIDGFDLTLGNLDASTITFNVVNGTVKTSILSAYPAANVHVGL